MMDTRGTSQAIARQRAVKGLTTVALLKANFDERHDHVGMFLPFVLDAVWSLRQDDFTAEEVRGALWDRHGLSVPLTTLRTLLKRAQRRGAVRREYGRYFKRRKALEDADIAPARQQIEHEHADLAQALREFAVGRGIEIESDEAALTLLLGFLSDNEIAVLLEERAPVEAAFHKMLSGHETRLVARFINDVCLPNAQLKGFLQRVIEGFVLQNALLLREIATAPRQFRDLEVFLDTGLLLRALGHEDEAAKVAARESLDLLRGTNARLAVFDKTVDEIKRILAVYEHKLGTPEGRRSLWPTEVTRHFLTERYTPADVRQAIALVERNLHQLGIVIRSTPARDRRFTLDEADLAQRLRRPGAAETDPIEARVQHDCDCVAAVLTLRARRAPESLDNARAVFVTTTPLVVHTVNGWWQASGEPGLSPIIHYIRLSNAAWLKKPTAATELKLQELVALCAAALRPSRAVWDRFLQHLRKLEASADLTSDEAVAVVVSSLSDQLLGEAEDIVGDDVDAATLTDVVDRVKAEYRAEADERVALAGAEADERVGDIEQQLAAAAARASAEAEEKRQLELRLRGFADTAARWVAWTVLGVPAVVVIVGSFAGLRLGFPGPGSLPALMVWGAVAIVAALSAYALLHHPLKAWRLALESRMRRVFRRWLFPKALATGRQLGEDVLGSFES